jgi:hypothetical protein
VPLVHRDPRLWQRRRTPEAYGADGSMTATSTASRKAGVCSASQVDTQAPVRPGSGAATRRAAGVGVDERGQPTGRCGATRPARASSGPTGRGSRRCRPPRPVPVVAASRRRRRPAPGAPSARTPVPAGDLVDGPVRSGHGTGEVLPQPCGQPRPRRDRGVGPGERPLRARVLQAAGGACATTAAPAAPRRGRSRIRTSGRSFTRLDSTPQRGHQPIVRLVSITTRSPPSSTRSTSATREGVQAEQQRRRVVHARGLACRSASEQPACAGHEPVYAPTPRSKSESRVTRPLG